MPAEDRSKYAKIAGLVLLVGIIIVLLTLINQCHTGDNPQGGDDDVTRTEQVAPTPRPA